MNRNLVLYFFVTTINGRSSSEIAVNAGIEIERA